MAATSASARASVLRSALLFTPFLLVTLGAFGFIVQDVLSDGASAGRVVGLLLVGSVTMLFGYQVLQSIRDLFSPLVETDGLVERRWSRNDFFLFRNTYIFVERNVFRLDPAQALEIDLGDTVRVVHYPHTSAVESVEVLARARQGGSNVHG